MRQAFIFALLLLPLVSLSAQQDSAYVPDIETFMQIGYCSTPAVSTDGGQFFFQSAMSGVTQLYRLNQQGWPYQLTLFPDGIDSYVLSHDGKSLIVGASVGGNERSQLYQIDAKTGRVRQLTDQPQVGFGSVIYAPDDKTIYYRSNEVNGTDFDIWSLDLATGQARMVQKKQGYNGPMAATSDSRYLLTYNFESNAQSNFFLYDFVNGEERLLTEHEGEKLYDYGHLTRDGKSLYCITDNNADGIPRTARLDLESGQWEAVGTQSQWEHESLLLSPDDRYLIWILNEDGYSSLQIMDLRTGEMREAPPLAGSYSDLAVSATGDLAFGFNSARYAPDVWHWSIEKQVLEQLTFSTYAGIDSDMFVEPTLIRIASFDGLEIPAFLYLPRDYSGGPIPFIIHAHGGPESQFRPTFNRHFQYLLLHGFGLLAVNPRGSSGYGQEYQQLDNYKKRLDSVKDYAWAANWLIDQGYTSSDRLGVKGASYGGYMTMALVTEYPDLFAAGLNEVGIVNFVTFLENTADYRRALREAEYGPLDDREFLESVSPIRKADQIKAALLIVHGENDPRVPVSEARQVLATMQEHGSPVDSLIFPDEGHGVGKRSNRLALYRSMVDFFMKYLKH